jgi:hypothetical protein
LTSTLTFQNANGHVMHPAMQTDLMFAKAGQGAALDREIAGPGPAMRAADPELLRFAETADREMLLAALPD